MSTSPANPTSCAPTSPERPVRWWGRLDPVTWVTLLGVAVALYIGIVSLRATNNSLRQSNLATIYTLGAEITKVEQATPSIAKFFDKTRRPAMTDEEIWGEFKKLPPDEQTRIKLHCEQIADFLQIAFLQREALPADDWDTWWSYSIDLYDESPIYRDFLAQRPRWYVFMGQGAFKPENRARYYRGYQKK
jgi:hypothetical protein